MRKFFLALALCFSVFAYSANAESRLNKISGFSAHPMRRLQQLRSLSKEFEKQHPFTASPIAIDIFIPTLEKEIPVLQHTVSYARRNILHPIQNIYIVAPDSALLRDFCIQTGCQFIDENTVLPLRMKDIDYFPQGVDRRGWIFQQLLKLNADRICASEHILILDSDTVLIRPQSFIFEKYIILECSDEQTFPYLLAYEKLFSKKREAPFSFVCHHMLFEKTKLRHLKETIESLHHMPWYEAILATLDKNEISGFSEYETYGNFFVSHYPDQFLQLHFFNVSYNRQFLIPLSNGELYPLKPFGHFTKSISFHDWMNH